MMAILNDKKSMESATNAVTGCWLGNRCKQESLSDCGEVHKAVMQNAKYEIQIQIQIQIMSTKYKYKITTTKIPQV